MRQNTVRIAVVGAAGKVAPHSHPTAVHGRRAELAALCDFDSGKLVQLGAGLTDSGLNRLFTERNRRAVRITWRSN